MQGHLDGGRGGKVLEQQQAQSPTAFLRKRGWKKEDNVMHRPLLEKGSSEKKKRGNEDPEEKRHYPSP